MVFTVEEDVNHPSQVMLPKGKQSKQRKNSGTPRRGKNVASNSTTKMKKSSKGLETLAPLEVGADPSLIQEDMANITTVLPTNTDITTASVPPLSDPAPVAFEEPHSNPTLDVKPALPVCDSPSLISELQRKKKSESKSNSKSPKSPSDELVTSQSESQSAVNEKPNKNAQIPNDLNSEIARLKKLLLLQVSLISRQQDLQRLRDREIMQLKASNQNYKCQLNRVRRRISNKTENAWEELIRSDMPQVSRRKTSVDSNDCDVSSTTKSLGDIARATGDIVPATSTSSYVSANSQSGAYVTYDSLSSKTPQKRRRISSKEIQESHPAPGDASLIPHGVAEPTGMRETPTKLSPTPKNEKGKIPVPVSFIERRQTELIEALIASPPDKALKNFCSIADSPSPSSSADVTLAEFPFKICDRCPHCVAIAAEIARLIKIAECSASESVRGLKTQDFELLKLAAIDTWNTGNNTVNKLNNTKSNRIMRTPVSYFRHPPTFDPDHWWWDLKCGTLKTEDKLNIPTWKEQMYTPLHLNAENSDEASQELTDDLTFTKRHMKQEQDEKRRKRWDIQRIREYRYNEKLRQKLMKQAAVYEAPVIETFAGHLHDAESVEVHDSLPVNVFGYPAPQMELEEFSLTSMYQMSKSLASGAGRRKSRKIT